MGDVANKTDNPTDLPSWPGLWEIKKRTRNQALKKACSKLKIGRPVEYTDEIGGFICNLISEGKTVQNIIDIYNESTPIIKLTRRKIYAWLHNSELKHFRYNFTFARELSSNGILDDMIDMEDDIISDTVSFKSGRVVLESKRWRAKVQNPDYFNPVKKVEEDHKHEIIIRANIPEPLPLPDTHNVVEAEYEDAGSIRPGLGGPAEGDVGRG